MNPGSTRSKHLYIFFSPGASPNTRFFSRSTRIYPISGFPSIKHFHRGFATRLGLTSVNLSLPHSQAFVSDSRTQGWHCRGRVAEGSRGSKGGRGQGKRACTVFLAAGGKGERVGWSDGIARGTRRGVVLSSTVVSVPEPRGRKREGATDDDGVDSDTGDSDGDRK